VCSPSSARERIARRCWPLAGKGRGHASAAPRRVHSKLSLCIGSEASSDAGTDFRTTTRCPRSARTVDQNKKEEPILNENQELVEKEKKQKRFPLNKEPRAVHLRQGEAPPGRRDADRRVRHRPEASEDRSSETPDREVDKKSVVRAGIFRKRRRSMATRPRTPGATASGYGVWTRTSRSPRRSSRRRRSA
jgi:hypothetical protein